MTDDWDFYSSRIDDKPASLYVDLGAADLAPVPSLPHLAYARLRMRAPREDGLSSKEEFDALIRIEDALTEALCADHTAHVGRSTSDGHRNFYFYVAEPATWSARVASVMAAFPDYDCRAGTRQDAAWSMYLNVLLPGAWDRERIENRRVCEQLEEHGDQLNLKREIDHWIWLPTRAAVDAFIAEVRPLGFQPRDDAEYDSERRAFSVHVARVDAPSFAGIDAVVRPLFDAAQRHGGEYDGWGCSVAG